MAFLDDVENQDVKLVAHGLSCDFYKEREHLLYLVKRYYNQSIGGDYIKEDDIIASLNHCVSLKSTYRMLTDKIPRESR